MKHLHNTLRLFALSLRKELKDIAASPTSLLVIIGGVVVYGLLYNFLYRPNIVREAPIVVVDNSHTQLSRRLERMIDASSGAEVVAVVSDFGTARQMLNETQAEAIIYLPHDMEKRIGKGERAVFVTLSSTATLLYYEATVGAVMEAMLALGEEIRSDMVWTLPSPLVTTLSQRKTTEVVGNALFNPTKGYADYLLPVVFIIILFQTMVMVVSTHCGKRRANGITPLRGRKIGLGSRLIITLARSSLYYIIYGAMSLFLIGLLPHIFDLPHLASARELLVLLSPFLLATSLFGQAFGRLFGDGEAPILLITFFSVGLIFLAGISYPLELLPTGWRAVHYLFPAAPATLAFVELGSMGSSLANIAPQLGILWLQAIIYLLCIIIPSRRFR